MGNTWVNNNSNISLFYSTNIKNESEGVAPSRASAEGRCTPPEQMRAELKLKHVILLLSQLGHLLPDRLHECRGGETAQGHAVHVLQHLGQTLLGCCARGGGRLIQCLVVLQGQPDGASLWVTRVRKSLNIPRQRHLENSADRTYSNLIITVH